MLDLNVYREAVKRQWRVVVKTASGTRPGPGGPGQGCGTYSPVLLRVIGTTCDSEWQTLGSSAEHGDECFGAAMTDSFPLLLMPPGMVRHVELRLDGGAPKSDGRGKHCGWFLDEASGPCLQCAARFIWTHVHAHAQACMHARTRMCPCAHEALCTTA